MSKRTKRKGDLINAKARAWIRQCYKRGKVFWISYYASGNHICESSHSREKSDAKRFLQQRLGEVAGGRYVGPRADRITFDELAEDMLNDYRINNKKASRMHKERLGLLLVSSAGEKLNRITC